MFELTLVFPSKNKYTLTHTHNSQYLQYQYEMGNTTVYVPRYEDIFKDIILNKNCSHWIGNNKTEEYAMEGIAYFNCKEIINEFYEMRRERRRKELHKEIENFFELIIKHIQTQKTIIPLFWENLSQNSSLSEQFFEKYIEHVHWESLLTNTNISEQFYEKHIKNENQYKFLRNKYVSQQFIEKYYFYIDKKWLYSNYNLPYTFIDKHLFDETLVAALKIKYLLFNPYINKEKFCKRYKLDNIERKPNSKPPCKLDKHITNSIDWDLVSYDTNKTEQFFEKHFPHINWDHLIVNTNISPQFFKKYIHYIPFPGLACLYDKNKNIILQYFSNITKNTFEKYIERTINKEFNLILY